MAIYLAMTIYFDQPIFWLMLFPMIGLLAAGSLYGFRARQIPEKAVSRRGQFSLKGLLSAITLMSVVLGYGRMLARDVPRLERLSIRQNEAKRAFEYNQANWLDTYPDQPRRISFNVFLGTMRDIHWGINDRKLEDFPLARLYTSDDLFDVTGWLGDRATPWTEAELQAKYQHYLKINPKTEATLEEFRIIAQAHRIFLEIEEDPLRRRDLEGLYLEFLDRVVAPNAPKQDWNLDEYRRRALDVFSADRIFRREAVKHGSLIGLFFIFAAFLLRPALPKKST